MNPIPGTPSEEEDGLIDLADPGAQELIKLTNQQFGIWQKNVRELSGLEFQEIPEPDFNIGPVGVELPQKGDDKYNYMYHWFILSGLSRCKNYMAIKDNVFIRGISQHTSKKYVSELIELGLAATMKVRGQTFLALTQEGQLALRKTITSWKNEFGNIQDTYFRG